MPKLCQILAVEKQVKSTSDEQATALYQLLQKEALLNGVARTYAPLAEDGEKFPDERNDVQTRVHRVISKIADFTIPLYDITATRDSANLKAKADVMVDDVTILKDVPAVTLLFLEKQLVHVHTVICSLPTLPSTETWEFDTNVDAYRTPETKTSKSKKVPKVLVKAPATDKHPAQVDLVHEDVLVGYWTTFKFSGAISSEKKQELRERCEKLLAAVKFARETANQVDAPKVSIGKPLFEYLFGGA